MYNEYWDIKKYEIYLFFCLTQLLIDVASQSVLEFYTRGKMEPHLGPREDNKILTGDRSAKSINMCETKHLNSSNLTPNLTTLQKTKSKIAVSLSSCSASRKLFLVTCSAFEHFLNRDICYLM